jgi:hypothetical protein
VFRIFRTSKTDRQTDTHTHTHTHAHENGMAYVWQHVLSNAGRKTKSSLDKLRSHSSLSQNLQPSRVARGRSSLRRRAVLKHCKPPALNYSALRTKTWGEYGVFGECREVERPVLVRRSKLDGVKMSRILKTQ